MSRFKDLKYDKKYVNLIFAGKKRYEIRKASKGITTGTRRMTSIDKKITYGYAHYELLGANVKLNFGNGRIASSFDSWAKIGDKYISIDSHTYKWAKKNYIDKGIDYVILKISEVRKGKGNKNGN